MREPWSRSHEFYAFRIDPGRSDHYLLDGASRPFLREAVEVQYGEGRVTGTETREFWSTEFGPIVHRADSLVYVYRSANLGDLRAGEQWLEMMKATSLEEWREAMRIGAGMTPNFTYADAAGTILYVSVQAVPLLPHPVGGDTVAILATRGDQLWSRVASFDSLPQVVNPVGGYLHNESDSPHHANLNQILDHSFSFWVQEPRLRLRSQHGAMLLHNDRTFTLEDVVEAKHSMRMLLADRVKEDLLDAVRGGEATVEVTRAIELIAAWDNTAAAEAFAEAVRETSARFGAWNVAWGEVHRVRRGAVDAPVGGCGGALGCFRVLNFSPDADGRRVVDGGDGWVLAVEFGEQPRAYWVLAYGQSPDPASPYYDNQAALFAGNQLKPVLWTEPEIEAAVRERYRPGAEPARIGTARGRP